MALIIPGVEVKVVKEVLAPQLAPSGVLGLIGLTEKCPPEGIGRVQSWSRFVELFGAGSAHSMPEAAQALANGVSELVVVPVQSSTAKVAKATVSGLTLTAKAKGTWANGLKVSVKKRGAAYELSLYREGQEDKPLEVHRNLLLESSPSSEKLANLKNGLDTLQAKLNIYNLSVEIASKYGDLTAADLEKQKEGIKFFNLLGFDEDLKNIIDCNIPVLIQQSDFDTIKGQIENALKNVNVSEVKKAVQKAIPDGSKLDKNFQALIKSVKNTVTKAINTATPSDKADAQSAIAKVQNKIALLEGSEDYIGKRLESDSQYIKVGDSAGETLTAKFAKGADASPDDYKKALIKLENEPDVDLVLASIGGINKTDDLSNIYTAIKSHCNKMSTQSQGRIGFAQVPDDNESTIETKAGELTETLISDRLVLVAPGKAAGAVAGMIGSLDYFQSPTFKSVSLAGIEPRLDVETQEALLKQNVVPIVSYRGRGIIVVRGLTSDGDQINVRRTADHAVRGVKAIGELFIGRLNNEEGRGALQQNLTAFLLQMEKDGALVPSTDGLSPAFSVNVYSSQTDFAQGIVRVEMAVRPVRAIDYIYATVTVQV